MSCNSCNSNDGTNMDDDMFCNVKEFVKQAVAAHTNNKENAEEKIREYLQTVLKRYA